MTDHLKGHNSETSNAPLNDPMRILCPRTQFSTEKFFSFPSRMPSGSGTLLKADALLPEAWKRVNPPPAPAISPFRFWIQAMAGSYSPLNPTKPSTGSNMQNKQAARKT